MTDQSPIIIKDRIFGEFTISEPVLIDLIHSEAVQRLHHIYQHGVSALVDVSPVTTRYEHSIGVFLLTRMMGADLHEQIAALLHDVSHTVFSHVIDHVFEQEDTQGYHEEHKTPFIENSDIPAILSNHGFNWKDYLDETRFTLLEQSAPDLCADRIDYSLRDAVDRNLIPRKTIDQIIADFKNHQGKIVMQTPALAKQLALAYQTADDTSWCNFDEVGLYELTAHAIRLALEKKLINQKDLWSSDRLFWDKLNTFEAHEIKQIIPFIAKNTIYREDQESPHYSVSPKIRTIDPPILLNGAVKNLSQLDEDYKQHRLAYIDKKSGVMNIRVEGLPPFN